MEDYAGCQKSMKVLWLGQRSRFSIAAFDDINQPRDHHYARVVGKAAKK